MMTTPLCNCFNACRTHCVETAKNKKKSLVKFFDHCMQISKQLYDIHRSFKGWTKKFNRISQEYSAFVGKISESERSGDEDDLYQLPPFYKQIHELERGEARYVPPTHESTDDCDEEKSSASSRKRSRMAQSAVLEDCMERQEKRHKDLLEKLKRRTNERRLLFESFEKLFKKLY